MAVAKKMTIRDVALATDISISIVLLVLSEKGRVSFTIDERVNAAIEQLRFMRNRQASVPHNGQSGAIGLVMRDLSTPLYTELIVGLTEALEVQGHMVFLSHSDRDGEQLAQRSATLPNQGADGAAVAGAIGDSDDLQQLAADKGIPVVFTSRANHLDDVDAVRSDDMQVAQLLAEHLIRHGYQRIAWLGGQSPSLTHAGRADGYRTTLLKYGLPFHSGWAPERLSSQKQAAEKVIALLRRNPTISAVVYCNEIVAAGAQSGLMGAGHQSGEIGVDRYFEQQISLVGFTDVAESTLDDIPIIWVYTPTREVGYTLAECMPQRIGHDDDHSRNLASSARLVVAK